VTGDQFTRRLWGWLQQVLADRKLRPLALHVAVYLCARFNRETGDAFPSQERIAEALQVSRRGVQGAIRQLAEHGHLQVDVNKGRRHEDKYNRNRYRPLLKKTPELNANQSAHLVEVKCEPECAWGANGSAPGGRTGVRTNYKKEPFQEPPAEMDAQFDAFYSAFPRHVAKGSARRAFHRIIKNGSATAEQLILGAKRYAAERAGQDPRYTKHPATWLNGECWKDESASVDQNAAWQSDPNVLWRHGS